MVIQNNRSGYTKITSVSVSKEMIKIIEQYNLSPSEVFRRGMGVTLCDMDVPPYCNSVMNKNRSEFVKKFIMSLEKVEILERYNQNLESIKKFNQARSRIKKSLSDASNALIDVRSMEDTL